MKREWTDQQKLAIDERKRTLLVSAAAGSGKTAVLTERIIKTLSDPDNPTDISRLLVVTFTRAAAAEMRSRIAKALGEAMALHPGNAALRRQLMLLGSAKISTIDSFYLDLVRANFEEAGFSPSFRMADEGELLSLRRDTMSAAIDKMYRECPAFIAVAELLSDVRSEQSLTEALLEIEKKLIKLPNGYDTLLDSATENELCHQMPILSRAGQELYGALDKTAAGGTQLYEEMLERFAAHPCATQLLKKFGGAYGEMLDVLREVRYAIDEKNLDKLCHLLGAPLTQRVGSHKMPEDCSEELLLGITMCKDFREKWRARAAELALFTPDEIRDGGKEAAELLRLLHRVLTEFGQAYNAAKREREVAEFTDISRAAYKLLVDPNGAPTPLATSLSDAFDAVYIDEYQDVDAMQDATFRAISKPHNRFMVGDIKQSIYRFRGADPRVFTQYRKSFPDIAAATPSDPAATIFMSNCFRCDETVVDFSNTVSGFLFSETAESIGYQKNDDLVFSKKMPEGAVATPCSVLIYDETIVDDTVPDAERKPEHAEAKMIAAEIQQLLLKGKKNDGTPITPGDIAVLYRGGSFAASMAGQLKAAGIPVNDTSRENFFENPEVLCMYSLLAAIDNPFRDVYLAAVMRSPFFGFTLEELVSIRQATDGSLSLYESAKAAPAALKDAALCGRLSRFLSKLKRYREKAEQLPVDKLLRYLYRDTAVLSFVGDAHGEETAQQSKRQNLLRLYEYARCFEAGGFKGLYRFVRYVEDIMQNGTEMPTPDGPRDAVSLITIHHSKGLEYPVCFVATAGKQFNREDEQEQLLIDAELGCGTRVPNMGTFSRANTFIREAIKKRLARLAMEEEMRVLYVAMTRARERLYVTAKPVGGVARMKARLALATSPLTSHYRLSGISYIEWILTALETHVGNTDFCRVEYRGPLTLYQQQLAAKQSQPSTEAPTASEAEIATAREKFAKRFDFSYPTTHLSQLPAKLSVSRLTPEVLDVYDNETAGSDALSDPDVEALLHTFERTPRFGADAAGKAPDAAERGTATHEFLQFCDFKKAENGIENEIERLINARFLPPEARDAIRRKELQKFFASAFYQTLSRATELYRETRFNVFLSAAEFTQNAALQAQLQEQKLLVQGVIDLFFTDENGNLVLCDYKTDRLPEEALHDATRAAAFLFGRHGDQLSYYKKALKAICGKEPDRTVIYSLPFGEALEEGR